MLDLACGPPGRCPPSRGWEPLAYSKI